MKKKITILVIAILVLIGTALLSGCEEEKVTDADKKQAAQTAAMMKEAHAQVEMPAIVNFQEKKLAKMLYELRDKEGVVCFWYLKSLEGMPVYQGKCIGYGIPYCVQFSNPERVVHQTTYNGGSFGTLPQPEPNGLFMPQSLAATWLMVIDPTTGNARAVYIEPEILVSPFPLPNAVGGPNK
jgi:hypothetical protein